MFKRDEKWGFEGGVCTFFNSYLNVHVFADRTRTREQPEFDCFCHSELMKIWDNCSFGNPGNLKDLKIIYEKVGIFYYVRLNEQRKLVFTKGKFNGCG